MAEEVAENEQTTEEPTDDLRGLLEEAFDEPEEAQAEAAPAGAEQAAEGDEKDSGNEAAADGGSESGEPAPAVAAEDLPPPIDWDAELREQWAGLAEPVRKKIADREQQIAQAMQGTAQARQVAQGISGIANQFGSVMAAEGAQNPIEMFGTLMQTVAELRMGTPQQKAQRLAALVQHYGVGIEDLDSALAAHYGGQDAEQVTQQSQLEQLLDQRLQPVNQMMQQMQGMQQQRTIASQQEAIQEVDAFAANHEFLNDVRHDMADLIDLATRQGREMGIEDAYNKACSMHPQIANIIQQREEQERLTQASQSVASKKAAASSLAPSNLGGNTSAVGDSITSALNAAWDDQLGR